MILKLSNSISRKIWLTEKLEKLIRFTKNTSYLVIFLSQQFCQRRCLEENQCLFYTLAFNSHIHEKYCGFLLFASNAIDVFEELRSGLVAFTVCTKLAGLLRTSFTKNIDISLLKDCIVWWFVTCSLLNDCSLTKMTSRRLRLQG